MAVKNTKKQIKKAKTSKKDVAPTKKKKVKKAKNNLVETKTPPKFYDQLKLSESYVSLVLGAVVVIAVFAFGFILILDSRDEVEEQRVLNTSTTPTPYENYVEEYTMLEGESLWDVAVKHYGDGFKWPEIVEANKDIIDNPDYVPPGTVIIIPEIE